MSLAHPLNLTILSKNNEKGLTPLFYSVSAAAEYENERDNYKPDGAVIKKIAKTVVHKKILRSNISRALRSRYYNMCGYRKRLQKAFC